MRIWRLLIAGLYLNCGFFVWAADATKLHILVAIDQEASGIGSMAQRSGSELVQRFNEIINSTTNPRGADAFNLAVIGNEGVDLSPRMIRGAIANLNVQPGESVLFYYLGHGGVDETSKEHVLQTSGGDMLRIELRRLLLGTKAKAAFIITDSCSSFVKIDIPQTETMTVCAACGAGNSSFLGEKVVRDLFFKTEGLVDVTASLIGTPAWYDSIYGGYFTSVFTEEINKGHALLDTNGDGFVAWKEFMPNLTHDVNRLYHIRKSDFAASTKLTAEMRKQDHQIPFPLYAPTKVAGQFVKFHANFAVFLETKQEYNVVVNGKRGMNIKLHFHADGLKDRRLDLNTYFRLNHNGAYLKDGRGGFVMIQKMVTPGFDDACFDGETIFIPYERLNLDGSGLIYFFVQIMDNQTTTLLANTRLVPMIVDAKSGFVDMGPNEREDILVPFAK